MIGSYSGQMLRQMHCHSFILNYLFQLGRSLRSLLSDLALPVTPQFSFWNAQLSDWHGRIAVHKHYTKALFFQITHSRACLRLHSRSLEEAGYEAIAN